MGFPSDIKVIETFVGMPSRNRKEVYKFLAPHLRDDESKGFRFPAQYMFKDVPQTGKANDFVKWTVDQMDRFNIDRALVG